MNDAVFEMISVRYPDVLDKYGCCPKLFFSDEEG